MSQTIRRIFVAVLCSLSLTGCFISNEPLIPENAGVLPIDRSTWIGADDFSPATAAGDGYLVSGEGAPTEPVRFSPLMAVNGSQYYVTEVPMDEGDGGWMYGVARRTVIDGIDGPVLQLALLDCSQLPGQVHQEMREKGWQVSDDDSEVCTPPDLEALKALFQDLIKPDMLESEDWWETQGN